MHRSGEGRPRQRGQPVQRPRGKGDQHTTKRRPMGWSRYERVGRVEDKYGGDG